MPTCEKCNINFPNYVKIDDKLKNISSRKYCLTCSPFGVHNTRKLHELDPGFRNCPKCKLIQSIKNFYNRRGKEGNSVYCKTCTFQDTTKRNQQIKKYCVDYKGGCCEICGYNKCISALEFHHKDPSLKDFTISKFKRKITQKIINELNKCELLCSNCHREKHYTLSDDF